MNVYDRIVALFKNQNRKFILLEHPPVKTCQDAALIRHTTPDQGAKALVCFADKKPVMVVLPCSRRLDFKLFKSLYGISDLRLASPEEVKELTSLEIGSIPPLGNIFNLPTYVDASLSLQEKIAFNAGDHSRSLIVKYSDYESVVDNLSVGNFTILA